MLNSYFRAALLAGGLALLAGAAHAQSVGIGTTAPNAKAALEISATDKGLLIPRMDSATRVAIGTPPDGLMVFQTDGRKGFWYAMSNSWLYIPDKTKSGDNLGNHTATQTLALADFDLRLRTAADANHGLGWYGTAASTKNWLSQSIDGPVLYGSVGGVLGTVSGGARSVLSWKNTGRVGIGVADPVKTVDVLGAIGLRNAAAWDHLYLGHDGSVAFLNAGGAEDGLVLRVGSGGTGGYDAQPYNEVMRLKPGGQVGINNNNPQKALDVTGQAQASTGFVTPATQDYAYATPKTYQLMVSPYDFMPEDPTASILVAVQSSANLPVGIYLSGTGAGQALAPLHLPQGAVITRVELFAIDNDGSTATATQARVATVQPTVGAIAGANATNFAVITGNSASVQLASTTASLTIDNNSNNYFVDFRASRTGGIILMQVRITYTVTKAD